MLVCLCNGAASQYALEIHAESSHELVKKKQNFKSLQAAQSHVQEVQLNLMASGYLSANVDSAKYDSLQGTAWLHIGQQYKWAELSARGIPDEYLNRSGFREKLYSKKPISPKKLSALIENLLAQYENNGYPFAQIKLKIDDIESSSIKAHLDIKPLDLITVDTIHIKGAQINYKYLCNSIKIHNGDPYNQKLFEEINIRIKELQFLRSSKAPEVIFERGKADIYVYLAKNNANNFNGILGVLPDNNGKITFTGDIKLGLTNAFNRGEKLGFHWQKLQTQTQELDISTYFPYFLGSPFGIGGSFNLYKRDSTYLEVQPEANLRLQLPGNSFVGIFIKNYTSTVLDEERFKWSPVLPQFNNTRKNTFGVELLFQNLDYRLNPRKGYTLTAKGGAGFKTIIPLDSVDISVYDNVQLRTNHYEISGKGQVFIPLLGRTTFMLGAQGHWLINDPIFINEMKRLGGLQTIRGFDDQSILASSHIIGTLEYRFLLEQNSYLYTFFDYGYFENRATDSLAFDSPRSFGLGISFQTKAGIFTLSYALGRLSDGEFLLRSAKIHFGFINYF